MWREVCRLASIGFCFVLACASTSQAQKRGGVLVLSHIDSPPSPSIQEEGTSSVSIPFMSMFNNLVIYDQHKPINTFDTIMPELATKWAWNVGSTAITFTLREGVSWHDGKPFTSADVKCTWEMVSGLVPDKIRKSPRREWWDNLERISVNGAAEVSFHLKRPQPSFIALLAAGWSGDSSALSSGAASLKTATSSSSSSPTTNRCGAPSRVSASGGSQSLSSTPRSVRLDTTTEKPAICEISRRRSLTTSTCRASR